MKGKRKRTERQPDYKTVWVKRDVLSIANLSRMDIARLNPDASINRLMELEAQL